MINQFVIYNIITLAQTCEMLYRFMFLEICVFNTKFINNFYLTLI